MKLGIIGGPGHHAPTLAAALHRADRPVRLVTQYPGLRVVDLGLGPANQASAWSRALHDSIRRVAAAVQFRAARHLPSSLDFLVYNGVYARLAEREVRDADAVIAFTFVAEPALAWSPSRRAILEEPATHVTEYQRIVHEEHLAAGRPLDPRSIRLPAAVVEQARREYALAPRIHVLSTFARESFVRAGVGADKVRVIAPGVDTDFFVSTPVNTSPTLRLLYVGRLELAKGLRSLLLAMERLRHLNIELELVGGLTEPVRQLLSQTTARVRLSGVLAGEELRKAYARSHALVFPSLTDGFGLVVLEAMASGRAVIGSRASGAPDAVSEGVEGFLVEPGDVEGLASRMQELSRSPELVVSMGAAAAHRARGEFSLAAYRSRLDAVYRSI